MQNNLKKILNDRGISQRELARATGLTSCTVSRYANGVNSGDDIVVWYKIITFLDVDWPDMFPDFYEMEEIDDGESEVQAD